ncbi:interleukin-10 receptor subunit beta-like [Chelmon rostratus]|uniref:interleukin-10 receptor subunit beta-like n=1 Tax=Chelmon rostratus TaxID=109905 RepID=UPI001BEA75CE|nr:interleukin-10 receptor subunit beta-like [Chelmon rostratus]
MSARVCALILTLSALCGSTAASGVLSSPTNVRLTSYNMNLVLRWDPPEGAAGGLVYTTEYKTPVTSYRVGCVNTSHLECDFTRLNISIIEYGIYTGRVQAQVGAKRSGWVESRHITLDKDTIIGSPNVSLFSNGATIDVSIKDPVFVVSELRNVYIFATYNITYWKDGQVEKAKSISNKQQSRVVLSELELWTKYCVQVQINTERNSKPSEPSKIVCESTTSREEAPWVAAIVTFVIMAVAVALVVLAVVYRESISHFLCPKDALPQHFKEYLQAPPTSSTYLAMQYSRPPKEIYHQISIVAEEGRPLEAGGMSCSKQPDVRAGGELQEKRERLKSTEAVKKS